MKRRSSYLLGLASLGLVLTTPALADHSTLQTGYSAGGFVLAKRNDNEAKPELRRDSHEEFRARDRNVQERESVRHGAPSDYGYGYERRHQPRPDERGHDERGRR